MAFLKSILEKVLGNKSDKDVKLILPMVEQINSEFDKLQSITNDELREKTNKLKSEIVEYIADDLKEIEKLEREVETIDIEEREDYYRKIDSKKKEILKKQEEVLEDILPEAFAIMKETANRFKKAEIKVKANDYDKELASKKASVVIEGESAIYKNSWLAGGSEILWDMLHYDVQLIGGIILHQGKIAEMATGEGKTLVATLPVFLNALTGKGVHIVTVNNYLAKRDSEWMGPLFEFHGLSVDCIDKHQPNTEARRNAYKADVTYGTNNEFGFDYLRDNMADETKELVQRTHHYTIVDEVDSVLIDDARTPLIISGPTARKDNKMFNELKPQVDQLVKVQRTLVNKMFTEAKKLIDTNNKKEGGFKLLQSFKGLPKNKSLIKFLSVEGIRSLLLKTENNYMQDNSKNMHLVTDELYFVIDEKQNSIDLTDRGLDLLSGSNSDSEFFILPQISELIAEIDKREDTPTKKAVAKDKLLSDYSIKSERIHTINQLLKAYTLFEPDIEYVVLDNKIKIVDEQTGRILDGRRYSDGLHQALEAKENVKIEAATQTYATVTLQNYFRMYHKIAGMTGTAETEAGELWDIYKLDVVVIPTNKPIVRNDIEDMIFKTKREKYNAVIDEVAVLSKEGRPTLVGTTSVEISELLNRMFIRRGIKPNVLNAKLHQKEADIVAEAGMAGTVTIATNMAGRGTDIKLQKEVVEAGGLAIVGTERHDSRRVDRQLRGRAGRQGDPGSSLFYVSLEDNLMRLFGSERIAKMMDRLGLKEGEVIQHKWISKSIERAQKKVEENNFGIRKRLLEYDDVMNSQREVIYKKRKHALFGERLSVDVLHSFYDICASIVEKTHNQVEFEDFNNELIRTLSIESPINNKDFLDMSADEITNEIYSTIIASYKRKVKTITDNVMPVIEDVYKNQAEQYKKIVVPITDGRKVYNIVVNLEKAYESKGHDVLKQLQKTIVLMNIDVAWHEHLRELDDLKQSVQNASYEQKDPLLIYKFESFELFKTMLDKVNKKIVSILLKANLQINNADNIQSGKEVRSKRKRQDYQTSRNENIDYSSNKEARENSDTQQKVQEPVKAEEKINRNAPCPCGSGKKYKQCHGKA